MGVRREGSDCQTRGTQAENDVSDDLYTIMRTQNDVDLSRICVCVHADAVDSVRLTPKANLVCRYSVRGR